MTSDKSSSVFAYLACTLTLSLSCVLFACNKPASNPPAGAGENAPGSVSEIASGEADQILKQLKNTAAGQRSDLTWKYVEALSRCTPKKQRAGGESIPALAKDSSVVSALLTHLPQASVPQQDIALFMLDEISEQMPLPESCWPVVIEVIHKGDRRIRPPLIFTLECTAGLSKNGKLKAALVNELSKEPDGDIRRLLAQSLGHVGDDDNSHIVFDALCRVIANDPDERVRAAALGCVAANAKLKKNHAREVTQLVRGGFQSKSRVIRREAIMAAALFGDKSATFVPDLIAVLGRPNETIGLGSTHTFAARSIGGIGPLAASSVPALRKVLHEDGVTNEALIALGAIGPAAGPAVPDIVSLAKDKDHTTSFIAIRTLGQLGITAKSALPALKDMLATANKYDKLALKQAIDKIEAANQS